MSNPPWYTKRCLTSIGVMLPGLNMAGGSIALGATIVQASTAVADAKQAATPSCESGLDCRVELLQQRFFPLSANPVTRHHDSSERKAQVCDPVSCDEGRGSCVFNIQRNSTLLACKTFGNGLTTRHTSVITYTGHLQLQPRVL